MDNLNTENNGEDIAIIGLAGRFPGADDIDMFWENIRNGVESIKFFTQEDLKNSNIDASLLNDPNYVKASAIIEDIDMFDAQFFGFNPREAEIYNPQHRMFLECSWEALENAGCNPETYGGRIGVYGGEGFNSYMFNIAANPHLAQTLNEMQVLMGNDKDFLATLISYKLNLKGPSMTVQSGCSTSLLAISLACQGLRNYQCDIALAGGIRLGIPQKTGYLYKEGSILSPDGHCRPFDENANGTVGGSGAAVVALKRVEDALEDGDYIYAVIKGTAINNDGSLKIGYTAPSTDGQAEAVYEALEVGTVSPETVGYVEAHGTGTVLGDPIEFDALCKAFRSKSKKESFCALGAVKANIGHLDAAAGAAGVIKTALALKNKTIPPSINFEKPNPKLKLDGSPFYIPKAASYWETNGTQRRAGVSSFGIGGTNVHAVLEEAPEIIGSQTSKIWHSIILSARSDKALENMTANLVGYLEKNPQANIADVAHTYQTGRKFFDFRKVIVCNSAENAVEILSLPHNERVIKGGGKVNGKNIIFMFPGQGSQYVNMGLELYKTENIFRKYIDLCSGILEPHLGLDLRGVLYPENGGEASRQINETYLAQPALFTVEYALAQTMMNYGIMPKAMIGHSVGEYVAACLAGVFSLEEVLPLMASRGRMMQGQPHGSMTAISAGEQEVQAFLLNEEVSIAAVNSPVSCVISGPENNVADIESRLEEKGIGFVRLHTSHAFHSPMMNSIIDPFIEKLKRVRLGEIRIPVISNVTGTWLKAEEAADPGYWAKHLAQTVKFSQGTTELLNDTDSLFLEIGPGNTLCTLVRQQKVQNMISRTIPVMRHPRVEGSDSAFLYCSIGKAWTEGGTVDWKQIYKGERRLRVPLPSYPFERQRYWIEADKQLQKFSGTMGKILKNQDISEWFYAPCWKPSAPIGDNDVAGSSWLIFADSLGIAEKLASKLRNKSAEVIMVFQGEQYCIYENEEYSLNPNNLEDYEKLFSHIKNRKQFPGTIIHLWSVGNTETEKADEHSEKVMQKGFYSLINIAKASGKLNIIDSIKLSVISSGVQQLYSEEEAYPEKATVLGACRVIPQEYANISCINIDIPIPQSIRLEEYITDSIIKESAAKESEYAVSYRGYTRWIQDFESIRPTVDKHSSYLRKNGVYMISGGLGNIGLIFAGYLAKEYGAKLILLGRIDFPEKNMWDHWIDLNGQDNHISRKILKLRQIEASGAEVMIYSADVSSEEDMKKVVSAAIERFGVLHGVIHAAGIVGESTYDSIQALDRSKAEEQFNAKIRGTINLEKALKGIELDFCLLISSLSAALGGLGLAAYSAANLFMDAFAKKHNSKQDVPWISINWDGWAFADRPKSPDGMYICPEEGVEVLKLILSQGMMSNMIISVGDLKQRIDRWIKGNNTKHKNNPEIRQERTEPYEKPETELEQKIADIWSEMVGVEPIGLDDNFFEIGGNSLLASQVIYRMRAELSLDMPIKEFFETPTIREIAEKIKCNNDNEKRIAEALNMVKALTGTEVKKLLEEVNEDRGI